MTIPDLADDPDDPQHGPQQRAVPASRSTWVSVAIKLILTITQVAVGILAKSHRRVADGIHSLSDQVAGLVLLFDSHHAKTHADQDAPGVKSVHGM